MKKKKKPQSKRAKRRAQERKARWSKPSPIREGETTEDAFARIKRGAPDISEGEQNFTISLNQRRMTLEVRGDRDGNEVRLVASLETARVGAWMNGQEVDLDAIFEHIAGGMTLAQVNLAVRAMDALNQAGEKFLGMG
jgi:hypothetical protein